MLAHIHGVPGKTSKSRAAATRAPTQARAVETRDAIVDAARALLLRDGFEGTSVNEIARRASVSVGSIYQYFSGRDAIIEEIAARHVGALFERMVRGLREVTALPLDAGVRHLAHLAVDVHRINPALHRLLESARPALGARVHLARAEAELTALTATYFEAHRDALVPDDPARAAFVVFGMVEALTHNAVLRRPELLDGDALVDDLTRLALGYLTGRSPAPVPPSRARSKRAR
jgi:AcrR family transcriptional regulator